MAIPLYEKRERILDLAEFTPAASLSWAVVEAERLLRKIGWPIDPQPTLSEARHARLRAKLPVNP